MVVNFFTLFRLSLRPEQTTASTILAIQFFRLMYQLHVKHSNLSSQYHTFCVYEIAVLHIGTEYRNEMINTFEKS
jgi:hypothetical protein